MRNTTNTSSMLSFWLTGLLLKEHACMFVIWNQLFRCHLRSVKNKEYFLNKAGELGVTFSE